jgi:sec-independent protein translocase protein TatC
MPVLTYVLAKIGILTGTFLKSTRKYSFVIILVLAAIITPSPDWTSQAIVAVPLLILFEISIIIASRIEKQQKKEEIEWS